MANSYTITIKFIANNESVKETEKKLNGVFNRVVKGFRNKLKQAGTALKLGAALTGVTMVLAKVISPLSALNDRINATLNRASGIKDKAEQAGTSVGSYAVLQSVAAAKGMDEGTFANLLNRMQTMVGAAKNGENNALYNYRDETDMGKVFYNVINSLRGITDKAQQNKMVADIFGQRATGALGALLNDGWDGDMQKIFKDLNVSSLEEAIAKLDTVSKKQAQLAARNGLLDLMDKSGVITEQVITRQAANQRQKDKDETAQIKNYNTYAMLEGMLNQILARVNKLVELIEPFTGVMQSGLDSILFLVDGISSVIGAIETKLRPFIQKVEGWLR